MVSSDFEQLLRRFIRNERESTWCTVVVFPLGSLKKRMTSAIAVLFEIMHTARITFARSPPGTTVGGW